MRRCGETGSWRVVAWPFIFRLAELNINLKMPTDDDDSVSMQTVSNISSFTAAEGSGEKAEPPIVSEKQRILG